MLLKDYKENNVNKETNDKILELLKQYLDKNPEQRFFQALVNIGAYEYEPFRPDMSVRIPRDPFYISNNNVIESLKKALKD